MMVIRPNGFFGEASVTAAFPCIGRVRRRSACCCRRPHCGGLLVDFTLRVPWPSSRCKQATSPAAGSCPCAKPHTLARPALLDSPADWVTEPDSHRCCPLRSRWDHPWDAGYPPFRLPPKVREQFRKPIRQLPGDQATCSPRIALAAQEQVAGPRRPMPLAGVERRDHRQPLVPSPRPIRSTRCGAGSSRFSFLLGLGRARTEVLSQRATYNEFAPASCRPRTRPAMPRSRRAPPSASANLVSNLLQSPLVLALLHTGPGRSIGFGTSSTSEAGFVSVPEAPDPFTQASELDRQMGNPRPSLNRSRMRRPRASRENRRNQPPQPWPAVE